ncbi:class I SAM-dependent methyltransferase [Planosporangium mesophilum]|uniref:Putative methyltransferase n=1 Tax=Planosporangium mesophilum TaxID=689768 RepID=A0A8J3X3G4_9ACTN|nr:class I SAM-dependent methyltransferase [Planosporangium mesophilum]NJC84162.1 class I SAM-dependent methyltransferase [Planosporangium mesophilum]GII22833.1 putative methyltransferase [Planosporangium mesophilum]
MSNFTGTVDYYRRYRPGIPTDVANVLIAASAVETPRRLLDLGTGTGHVVLAIGDRFDEVVAADPDAGMLAAAHDSLRAALPADVMLRLVHATAESFTTPPGWTASLVTICRAFHWMDKPAVLARLDQRVSPAGTVAIFADRSFWTASNPWQTAVRQIITEFLGTQRRAGDSVFTHADRPFGEILAESAFSVVEEVRVPVRRTWTAESVLGYLYSTSFAARRLFGDRVHEFEEAIISTLTEHSENGSLVEDNEFLIHLGRRRGPRTPTR